MAVIMLRTMDHSDVPNLNPFSYQNPKNLDDILFGKKLDLAKLVAGSKAMNKWSSVQPKGIGCILATGKIKARCSAGPSGWDELLWWMELRGG